MGTCRSKKMVRVHNQAFDLIDADGDHKVTQQELDVIADYIHAYHVQQSAMAHNKLATTKPEDYLYELLGKSRKSKLRRCHFNILLLEFHRLYGTQKFYLRLEARK